MRTGEARWASPETGGAAAYRLPRVDLWLTVVMRQSGVADDEAAAQFQISRPTWHLVRTRRGYYPGYAGLTPNAKKAAEWAAFAKRVEMWVTGHPRMAAWLRQRGMDVTAIWNELPLGSTDHAQPEGLTRRAMHRAAAAVPPPGEQISEEVVMIDSRTLRHFRLFRNPFALAIEGDRDLYWGDVQQYVYDCLWQVAHDAGFAVLVGEVGSGKTTIRQKLMRDLAKEDTVHLCYPQLIDKTKLTAEYIADAILYDLEGTEIRIPRLYEKKQRMVQQALRVRHADGRRHLLILEEAHLIPNHTLRYLKQYWEMTTEAKLGGERLLGILLIGQPELKVRLQEQMNWTVREMVRRCQLVELGPLNGDTRAYLQHLVKRAGGALERIMTPDAVDALVERLQTRDLASKTTISRTYPLTLQGCLIRAMREAYELHDSKIGADLIRRLVF